jgi:hypothetical protein
VEIERLRHLCLGAKGIRMQKRTAHNINPE